MSYYLVGTEVLELNLWPTLYDEISVISQRYPLMCTSVAYCGANGLQSIQIMEIICRLFQ